MKKLFKWGVIIFFCLIAIGTISGEDDDTDDTVTSSNVTSENDIDENETSKFNTYGLYETVEMENTSNLGSTYYEITMTDYGVFDDGDGDYYGYAEFYVKNTDSNNKMDIADYDFNIYQNNQSIEIAYPLHADDQLEDTTLTAGRETTCRLYFECDTTNLDAVEIEFGSIMFILR